jgi:type IV pilus assembly protein PilO
MAMTEKDKKQLMGLLVALPIGGIVLFWMFVRGPAQERITELETSVDSLERVVEVARRELAQGSVENLRQRVREFEQSLSIMRRLVPTDAEVANLIDDISTRARLRDIHVADLSPQGYEDGGPYRVARYGFTVLGHYDDVGAFLSDIASLPRIMVPHRLSVDVAEPREATAIGDTTSSLLRVSFQLRTFVKQPTMGEEAVSGDR